MGGGIVSYQNLLARLSTEPSSSDDQRLVQKLTNYDDLTAEKRRLFDGLVTGCQLVYHVTTPGASASQPWCNTDGLIGYRNPRQLFQILTTLV